MSPLLQHSAEQARLSKLEQHGWNISTGSWRRRMSEIDYARF